MFNESLFGVECGEADLRAEKGSSCKEAKAGEGGGSPLPFLYQTRQMQKRHTGTSTPGGGWGAGFNLLSGRSPPDRRLVELGRWGGLGHPGCLAKLSVSPGEAPACRSFAAAITKDSETKKINSENHSTRSKKGGRVGIKKNKNITNTSIR